MDVIWVSKAKYEDSHRIWLAFNNGVEGLFDFAHLITTYKIFAPLQDMDIFQSFTLDGWTLTWLDGSIDIAPEYLYEHLVHDDCSDNLVAEPEITWSATKG